MLNFPRKLTNYCSDFDNVPLHLHLLGLGEKLGLIIHGVEHLVI